MNKPIRYEAYGIILRSLLPADLEFLRAKRNDPKMRKWMTTDHEITADEMSSWYARLPDDAYYLLVEHDGVCVGHANAKPIGGGLYDPGYMFWDDDFVSQGGSVRAVMAFFKFMFDVVSIVGMKGLAACDNTRALRLAKGLGFESEGRTVVDGREYALLSLTPQAYARTCAKYKVLFK